MKKTCCTLVVGLASLLAAKAQPDFSPTNNAPAAPDANAPAAEAGTNAPAVVAEADAPTVPDTNIMVEEPTNATAPAPAVDVEVTGTNAALTTNAALAPGDTNAPAATDTPVVPATGIPQIKFSDVPLTTAIENLARLAGINYMLDPKIGYGQTDTKTGQVKSEPMLSIRWENISAENALTALLDNYGLQLVLDKKTGIHRITMKDPLALPPLFTKVIQLQYASVSNMVPAVQSVLIEPVKGQPARSKVMADSRTSQLVVVATDQEQQLVETLVKKLDMPTRQVLIETRLVEISSNPKTQKGVDWSGTLQAQHVTFGNGNASGTFTTSFPGGSSGTDGAGQPMGNSPWSTAGQVLNTVGHGGFTLNTKSGATPGIGFLNADGLSAVLSFLNTSSDAQVMSTPRVVTLDNEEAKISVVRGYPVFNIQASTANTTGGSQVSYTNVGTVLHVTPRISANNYIWLKVKPEVSSFFGNFTQTVPSTSGTDGSGTQAMTAPIFDFRTMDTQVLIPNANTLVMGGLVQDNPNESSTKVPLLGDIPGLGFFFRSSEKTLSKDNLIIFITPTIVKDDDFQPSHSAEFLKSRPLTMKDPMNPKTAWDGPRPRGDWSNPITDQAQ